MISKLTTIKRLAVFQDLDWNRDVRNKDNSVAHFKKINIIYGRNYSGKTTISRIVRALETGNLSDKYDNPECSILIKNENPVDQNDFLAHNKTVRVFNDDFVKESLQFIANPEKDIDSFAILGPGNIAIEREIESINNILGSNEEGNETNLYKEKLQLGKKDKELKVKYEQAIELLEAKLKKKATDNPSGIRYQVDKYGDQNYSIAKLKRAIDIVLKDNYTSLPEVKLESNLLLVKETVKESIDAILDLEFSFADISNRVKGLVERPISKAGKIDELLKDAIRNKWVGDGYKLHHQKLDTCLFCDNPIKENRWQELEDHFDKQSEELEIEINKVHVEITRESTIINSSLGINKIQFYSKYHSDLENLSEKYLALKNKYNDGLKSLTDQLQKRNNDILNEFKFQVAQDFSKELLDCRSTLDELIQKSNQYTQELGKEKTKAFKDLRLNTVYSFLIDIDYSNNITSINEKKNNLEVAQSATKAKSAEILEWEQLVNLKQRSLKDEDEGAKKVNKYFNDHFGNQYLELAAIEEEDEDLEGTKYRFEVQRDGRKAYHLSEGESRLLSFCYFMAKLEDIDTKGKKPIIWIDDPMSSLDSNHIFFVYSLIKSFLEDNEFEQVFISTHNLDFLKYLKQIKNPSKANFLIQREDKVSKIKVMPDYMKEYVTEFNYLFKQVYECSIMAEVTDLNYTSFYNFGNNARKFLEIFLYYKYPDKASISQKLLRFFGDENIPTLLTERINNEYSHMSGVFERGAKTIEVPEMHNTARLIISKIKEADLSQYNSLLISIGVDVVTDEEE